MSDNHMFDEPIEVQRERYQMVHLVHGVEYKRNPELRTRKKFVYAIAKCQIHGGKRWMDETDKVTLMRLANVIECEHPFGPNTESYAKAKGETP